MHRVISWAASHALAVVIAVVSVWALSVLPNLQIRISIDGMLLPNDPVMVHQQRVDDLFGTDDVTVVFVSVPDWFTPPSLRKVRDVVAAIEELPLVSGTASLFSMPHLCSVDGYVETSPYFDALPASHEAAG